MQGKVYVNARWKRLARLDGRLMDNIDFGYGLLGRLNKGGWFNLDRTRANETDWKTEMLRDSCVRPCCALQDDCQRYPGGAFRISRSSAKHNLSDAKRMLDSEYTVARDVGSRRSALR